LSAATVREVVEHFATRLGQQVVEALGGVEAGARVASALVRGDPEAAKSAGVGLELDGEEGKLEAAGVGLGELLVRVLVQTVHGQVVGPSEGAVVRARIAVDEVGLWLRDLVQGREARIGRGEVRGHAHARVVFKARGGVGGVEGVRKNPPLEQVGNLVLVARVVQTVPLGDVLGHGLGPKLGRRPAGVHDTVNVILDVGR